MVFRENYESDSLEEEMPSEKDEIPSARRSNKSGSKSNHTTKQTPATGGVSSNLEEQSGSNNQKNVNNIESFSQPVNFENSRDYSNIQQVLIVSSMENLKMTNLNTIKAARGIDEICPGKTEAVERHASGGLLSTVRNKTQAENLLNTTSFYMNTYPVKVTPYIHTEQCYGKLYAPEFMQDDLSSLISMLQNSGEIDIKKLYRYSTKSNIPLYVSTFQGTKCPSRIKVGYTIYNVEIFYPAPMRCTKYNKLKHSAKKCRAEAKICSKCDGKEHIRPDCKSEVAKCANCNQGQD